MKLKKTLSVLLTASALASGALALSGCGKTVSDVDLDEIMAAIPADQAESYVYPEQIEIKIPVYDRAQPGLPDVTDNYWTDYVQKEFGDKHNIKVTFISISRNDEITQFNQRLAGKPENQPDIIFNYDYPTIVNFAKQGAFRELSNEFIEHFAPDFYERTSYMDQYTYLEGKKLFLCGSRPTAYNSVTLVRKDWMDELGIDEPTSNEEYLDMLRAFRDAKLGGENTIAQTMSLGNANYGAYRYRPYPLSEHDNALYSDITVAALPWEPVKEALRYDNMLYNEGLISPEWYLDTDGSKAKEQFIAGQAGTFWCYLTKSPDIIASLKENDPDAEVTVLSSYDDELFGHPTPYRADNPFGLVSGINANCEHPEAVLMYFEWLNDNLFVMQNGIEGVTYTMEDDIPVLIDGYEGEERLNYNSNKDMWCLVIEGKDFGNEELNVKAQAETYAPDGYEELIYKSYENYQKTKDYSYCDYIFSTPIQSVSELSGVLLAKWQEIHTQLVNCKPEEFDALYESCSKEYLDLGYQRIIDEKEQVYQQESAQKKSGGENE